MSQNVKVSGLFEPKPFLSQPFICACIFFIYIYYHRCYDFLPLAPTSQQQVLGEAPGHRCGGVQHVARGHARLHFPLFSFLVEPVGLLSVKEIKNEANNLKCDIVINIRDTNKVQYTISIYIYTMFQTILIFKTKTHLRITWRWNICNMYIIDQEYKHHPNHVCLSFPDPAFFPCKGYERLGNQHMYTVHVYVDKYTPNLIKHH